MGPSLIHLMHAEFYDADRRACEPKSSRVTVKRRAYIVPTVREMPTATDTQVGDPTW